MIVWSRLLWRLRCFHASLSVDSWHRMCCVNFFCELLVSCFARLTVLPDVVLTVALCSVMFCYVLLCSVV